MPRRPSNLRPGKDYLDKLYKHALDRVNDYRKERGKQPLSALPKGHVGLGSACPIAKGLGLKQGGPVTVGELALYSLESRNLTPFLNAWGVEKPEHFREREEFYIDNPDEVAFFIFYFDEQLYPDLIQPD